MIEPTAARAGEKFEKARKRLDKAQRRFELAEREHKAAVAIKRAEELQKRIEAQVEIIQDVRVRVGSIRAKLEQAPADAGELAAFMVGNWNFFADEADAALDRIKNGIWR